MYRDLIDHIPQYERVVYYSFITHLVLIYYLRLLVKADVKVSFFKDTALTQALGFDKIFYGCTKVFK